MPETIPSSSFAATGASPAWLDLVRAKVETLRYGQVYIVVHDSRVTQIECLEKVRMGDSRGKAPGAQDSAA